MPERTSFSGDDLLEAGAEFGAVDVLVVLYEFEVGITGQVVAFEKDETFAFEGEGVLVELIEIKDAVGDLNGEFGVFHDIVMTEIARQRSMMALEMSDLISSSQLYSVCRRKGPRRIISISKCICLVSGMAVSWRRGTHFL